MMGRTEMEESWLTELREMEHHGFCGMTSGRQYRKRDAEKLVTLGLLRRLMMVMCDGDGFALEPEREHLGYALTHEGRTVAEIMEGRLDERAALAVGAEYHAREDCPGCALKREVYRRDAPTDTEDGT